MLGGGSLEDWVGVQRRLEGRLIFCAWIWVRAEGRGQGKAAAGQGRRQRWQWGGGCDGARDEERGEAGGVWRRQNREDPALDGWRWTDEAGSADLWQRRKSYGKNRRRKAVNIK